MVPALPCAGRERVMSRPRKIVDPEPAEDGLSLAERAPGPFACRVCGARAAATYPRTGWTQRRESNGLWSSKCGECAR